VLQAQVLPTSLLGAVFELVHHNVRKQHPSNSTNQVQFQSQNKKTELRSAFLGFGPILSRVLGLWAGLLFIQAP
jgi:hypothetical protein